MEKFQYMIIVIGAIFCVLLLLGFFVLNRSIRKKDDVIRSIAPCPDYWEEVKDTRVVKDTRMGTIITSDKVLCKVPSLANANMSNKMYDAKGFRLRGYDYLPEPVVVPPSNTDNVPPSNTDNVRRQKKNKKKRICSLR